MFTAKEKRDKWCKCLLICRASSVEWQWGWNEFRKRSQRKTAMVRTCDGQGRDVHIEKVEEIEGNWRKDTHWRDMEFWMPMKWHSDKENKQPHEDRRCRKKQGAVTFKANSFSHKDSDTRASSQDTADMSESTFHRWACCLPCPLTGPGSLRAVPRRCDTGAPVNVRLKPPQSHVSGAR